jgi:hypothetical protein
MLLRCSLLNSYSALYQDKDLLRPNSKRVRKLLEDDSNLESSADTFIFRLYGIGAVFNYKKKPVECITAFKEGYHNKYDEQQRLNLHGMTDDELWAFTENS